MRTTSQSATEFCEEKIESIHGNERCSSGGFIGSKIQTGLAFNTRAEGSSTGICKEMLEELEVVHRGLRMHRESKNNDEGVSDTKHHNCFLSYQNVH